MCVLFTSQSVAGDSPGVTLPNLCVSLAATTPESLLKYHWKCLLVFKFLFYFTHMSVCLGVCTCTVCMPGALRNQKRASDSLGPELLMFVSRHVGAGNRTLGPLQERPMLLVTEPPQQPWNFLFRSVKYWKLPQRKTIK